jgi:hypothetical protein
MADGVAGARIWIIGADHWPRAYLRAELIERGYEAVGFEDVADALVERALGRAPAPRLVVVDLLGRAENEGRLGALFRQGAPVVAVAGAAAAAEEQRHRHPWAAFLRRPVTIGEIADVVERGLGPSGQ